MLQGHTTAAAAAAAATSCIVDSTPSDRRCSKPRKSISVYIDVFCLLHPDAHLCISVLRTRNPVYP